VSKQLWVLRVYCTSVRKKSWFALAIYNGSIGATRRDIQSLESLIGNIMNDISVCVRLLI